MVWTIDNILSVEFNFEDYPKEELTELSVGFKKVVNTAQYETETIDSTVKLFIPKGLSGVEMILIHALVESQIEYNVICKLWMRGMIKDEDFLRSKDKISEYVSGIYTKAVNLGKKPDYLKI